MKVFLDGAQIANWQFELVEPWLLMGVNDVRRPTFLAIEFED